MVAHQVVIIMDYISLYSIIPIAIIGIRIAQSIAITQIVLLRHVPISQELSIIPTARIGCQHAQIHQETQLVLIGLAIIIYPIFYFGSMIQHVHHLNQIAIWHGPIEVVNQTYALTFLILHWQTVKQGKVIVCLVN